MQKNKQSGYRVYLDEVVKRLRQGEQMSREQLNVWLDNAEKYISAATEMTQDEAELLRQYFRRDLQEFADSYRQQRRAFRESPFYLSLVDTFWQSLAEITDKTQCEWQEIEQELARRSEYNSGDWVGLGRLKCANCGHEQQLSRPTQLTACQQCGHKRFIRHPFLP